MGNGAPAGIASITPIPTDPTPTDPTPTDSVDDQHLHPLSSVRAMKSRGHSRSLSVPMTPILQPTTESEADPPLWDDLLLGPEKYEYLNPIVLRKELERHLRQEKEILSEDFMKNSPVLFWNMVSANWF